MINKKKILGFVPARMGSKGIKNKNLKILNKKPLIYWPINILKKSKFVDTVLLSTDSAKIRKVGLKLGAEAPFLRPKRLATDNAMTTDAIKHALKFFSKKNIFFDYIIVCDPTSPFTTSLDVDMAIKKLEINSKKVDAVISIAENIAGHPKFCVKLKKNSKVKPYLKKFHRPMRQNLDNIYYYCGNFYLSKVSTLLEKSTFYHDRAIAIVSERYKAMEIDDPLDLILAKVIMESRKYLKK